MIWERKLDWIASKGGVALLNSHPDYMSFNGSDSQREEYPIRYYQEFLMYIKKNYDGKFFHAFQEGLLDDKIIGSYDVKYCYCNPLKELVTSPDKDVLIW